MKRTQQTAEPLAKARHLSITAIHEKNQPELVQKVRAAVQSGDVLIVAQQDTLPTSFSDWEAKRFLPSATMSLIA